MAATLATQTSLIAAAATSGTAGAVFAARCTLALIGPVVAPALIPPDLRRAVLRPASLAG